LFLTNSFKSLDQEILSKKNTEALIFGILYDF
jgi:hypothetical protein